MHAFTQSNGQLAYSKLHASTSSIGAVFNNEGTGETIYWILMSL